MNQRFVVFDVETTGNSPAKGEKIIQIAAVVVENGKIIDRYSSFVNPKQDIPKFIEQLTGITNEMVKDAPVFEDIAPKVKGLLCDAFFVAHNVLFDLSFIQEEFKNAGIGSFTGPKLDTVELSRILLPTFTSFKLTHLANSLSFSHEHPHQADSDAEVTANLLIFLISKLNSLPVLTLKKIHQFSHRLQSDIGVIFSVILREKLHSIQEEQTYFEFYKDIAIRKKRVIDNEDKNDHFDFAKIKNNFITKMQTLLENFEVRDGQLRMMDIVYEALTTNQHALIEAGTGIGKTLAYLIPSAFQANLTQKPIIISTYTLQLQNQIWERDIPLLKKILPFKINTAILKGRSNYINLPKFYNSLADEDHNYDTVLTILQILVWLTETETGDIDELNLPSGGVNYWEKVANRAETFQKNDTVDFYQHARNRAQNANLIITNHSLFFTDFNKDNTALPPHDVIIMDEAHHIESVASKHLGIQMNYVSILAHLTRLGTCEQGGLMKKVYTVFKKYGIDNEQPFYKIDEIVQNLMLDNDDVFRLLRMYVVKKVKNKTTSRLRYRFDIEKEDGRIWDSIIELVLRIKMQFTDLLAQFNNLKKRITPYLSQLNEKELNELDLFFLLQNKFEEIKEDLYQLFFCKSKKEVTWIETDERGAQNAAYLYRQSVDISELVANQLFSKKKAVVLTSATLTTEGTFSYLINQLGLEYFYPISVSIPSPFLYKEQVKLLVPTDLPAVNQVPLEEYVQSISEHIAQIASKLQGRMLVLFTSFEMLKATYSLLKDHQELGDYILIGQGISGGSRTKLTKSFQQFQKSILLGTNSFWEGIDIPGNDLACIIMVRLPFLSPEDPIMEAKSQLLEENGGDSYHELAIPSAIIRFKQGFGRLIRNKNDKGIIFVFDKRIITKRYGKKFIESLPEIDVHHEPLFQLLQKLKD